MSEQYNSAQGRAYKVPMRCAAISSSFVDRRKTQDTIREARALIAHPPNQPKLTLDLVDLLIDLYDQRTRLLDHLSACRYLRQSIFAPLSQEL